MRSDWQDAPPRVRGRRRASGWGLWWGLLGLLALLCAGLLSYGKTWVVDLAALQQLVHILDTGQPPQPESATLPASEAETEQAQSEPLTQQEHGAGVMAELAWQAAPPIRSGQQLRNEFNDSNYRPRAPQNIYAPPSYQAAPVTPERERAARAAPELSALWIKSWRGGTRYWAQWYSLHNYIDGATVCGNHRKGSIDYRECRKGAKQYFHEQCRLWRAKYLEDRADSSERRRQRYCSASSSFNPMG
ncbi:hypothetical protein [Pseudomonas sp. 5P_3.1_Bac2]|uniref:hypothetical protein n=1 Tax=Pseudomonas sp. 5P_3.1_Bac2 TaxID=2971617 RepID=UPI0021C57903|nr:hypothetical protein [Pseudomonas sp. 5P_3.1_Bac2]MCU1716806.1 hypothetical protein [Pseudomonas sp. 5P_3.1_Bac2]